MIKKTIFIILSVLWMCFIFYMSSKDAVSSTEDSVGIGMKICAVVYPGFGELSENEQLRIAMQYDFFVRKGAHCVEYIILSLLLGMAISSGNTRASNGSRKFAVLLAFIFTVLYAISDEIHQYFVPGRACQLRDVLIDSAGALIGCGIFYIIHLGVCRLKTKH